MDVFVVFSDEVSAGEDVSGGVFGVEGVPFVFDGECVCPFDELDFGCFYHFSLLAHHAADIGPLAMFLAWRALKEARFCVMLDDSPAFGLPAVLAPCSPKRMVLIWLPCLATTTWDLVGWLGVRLGLL